MKRTASKLLFSILFFILTVLFCAAISYAAKSTADVSADAAAKEKGRASILGSAVGKSVDEEYVIGYRDILHVSVYGEGSMAVGEGIRVQSSASAGEAGGDFLRGRGSGIEVRLDGRISLLHIGDISVVGMTLTQAADYLKQLYSIIYDTPSLTVTLVQSNSQQYTVMGQVVRPGLFHLDYPLNIVKVVARAGGFTEWANSEVTVIRQNSDKTIPGKGKGSKGETFMFDFDEFLKGRDLGKNILIKSGDVIVVH